MRYGFGGNFQKRRRRDSWRDIDARSERLIDPFNSENPHFNPEGAGQTPTLNFKIVIAGFVLKFKSLESENTDPSELVLNEYSVTQLCEYLEVA